MELGGGGGGGYFFLKGGGGGGGGLFLGFWLFRGLGLGGRLVGAAGGGEVF